MVSRIDIRSSIQNKLGLNPQIIPVHDKRAQGIAELILDVRKTFKKNLTETKLLDWHLMLLSGSPTPTLSIARFRTDEEAMQFCFGISWKMD